MTRSALYAHAVAELLKRHEEGQITERLNAVYAEDDGRLEPAVKAAGLRMLRQVEW